MFLWYFVQKNVASSIAIFEIKALGISWDNGRAPIIKFNYWWNSISSTFSKGFFFFLLFKKNSVRRLLEWVQEQSCSTMFSVPPSLRKLYLWNWIYHWNKGLMHTWKQSCFMFELKEIVNRYSPYRLVLLFFSHACSYWKYCALFVCLPFLKSDFQGNFISSPVFLFINCTSDEILKSRKKCLPFYSGNSTCMASGVWKCQFTGCFFLACCLSSYCLASYPSLNVSSDKNNRIKENTNWKK